MTEDAQTVFKASTTTSEKNIVFMFTRWEGEPNPCSYNEGYIREYKREIIVVQ